MEVIENTKFKKIISVLLIFALILNMFLPYTAKAAYKQDGQDKYNVLRISDITKSSSGNYTFYVEDGVSKILFEDLYEGECTFRASVSVVDFLNFIYASEAIVTSFINSKIKVNEASL